MNDIQNFVKKYFETQEWSDQPKNLYEPISYAMSSGGKRIRPVLALTACQLFGGDMKKVMAIAAAIETFHNFTLLHDDIMDNADTRRGRATVHKKWDANTAILSGDAMMIKAYQFLEQSDSDKLPELLHVFSKTALEVCEGQQYDMDFETQQVVTLDEYFEMIRLKTAVLLAASLKMGAIAANASKHDTNAVYDFGIAIGIAFQLRDDYLDTFGNEATFGKKIGGDIIDGKRTFLLINALEKASPTQKTQLEALLGDKTIEAQEKIHSVQRIFTELGIPQICENAMNGYYNKAIDAVESIENKDVSKNILIDIAKNLMGRTN